MNVDTVLKAETWRQLNVPKTKDSLRDMQRQFHPDMNADPKAHEAFVKAMSLFEGADFVSRVATGVATATHLIGWHMHKDFEDRKEPAVRALEKLSKLDPKFARFFPKVYDWGPDHVTIQYGAGWWFVEDFDKFDSRTAVWIAKRAGAAIIKAAECGLVHANINPKTVVLLPSEHGLMIDGWWHSVPAGERLQLKPEASTPAKYFGGAPADEQLMVAQLAVMLTDRAEADKLLAETFKKYTIGGKAKSFFNDVDTVAKKLYGPPSWHVLEQPSVSMI